MRKKVIIMLLGFVLFCINLMGCSCAKDIRIVGVWWWDDTLDSTYLSFAEEYGVNEIYYCSSKFDEDTVSFIDSAYTMGIGVYYLAGEYQWIFDNSKLIEKIGKYEEYQRNNPNSRYKGIHLDIEPHQSNEWKQASTEEEMVVLVQKLVDLAKYLDITYPSIRFQYDIPFWLDHMVTVDGEKKEAYKHMIDIADEIFLMSYRDTAEAIYDVSLDEINYATSVGKSVVLGIETYSTEGDKVSFAEEGKLYMYGEIDRLKTMVSSDTGICIHHIKKWYDLKD